MVLIIFSVVSQFRESGSREIIQSPPVQLNRWNSNNSRRIRRREKLLLELKDLNFTPSSSPANTGKESFGALVQKHPFLPILIELNVDSLYFALINFDQLWSETSILCLHKFLPPSNSPRVQLSIECFVIFIFGKLATCCELAATEDGSRCLWTFSRSPEPI